jgi:hypothetical protein
MLGVEPILLLLDHQVHLNAGESLAKQVAVEVCTSLAQ